MNTRKTAQLKFSVLGVVEKFLERVDVEGVHVLSALSFSSVTKKCSWRLVSGHLVGKNGLLDPPFGGRVVAVVTALWQPI